MELDEMKAAWQSLDARLAEQTALNLHLLRESRLDRIRHGLRPLLVGQLLQIVSGVGVVLLGGSFWPDHRDVTHLLVAGILVHVYGVLLIAGGAITIGHVRRIDHAGPVIELQRRLAQLRRVYVVSGLVAGLAWWFVWMPILMVVFGHLGVDLYQRAPSVIGWGIATGVVGLLLTWWFARWARDPKRPAMARALDESLAGGSITRAQRFVDELEQFRKE